VNWRAIHQKRRFQCSVVMRRAKTKGEVRLDHNELGIVRRATHPCHWFWCAGAPRQRGNINLNKLAIQEMSV
jgi:hypothetical protein